MVVNIKGIIMKYIFLSTIVFLSSLFMSIAQEPMLSQPKIVVLPKSLGGVDALTLMKKDSLVNTTVAAIKQVLVERKLEVADLEGLIGNADFNRSLMLNLMFKLLMKVEGKKPKLTLM